MKMHVETKEIETGGAVMAPPFLFEKPLFLTAGE